MLSKILRKKRYKGRKEVREEPSTSSSALLEKALE